MCFRNDSLLSVSFCLCYVCPACIVVNSLNLRRSDVSKIGLNHTLDFTTDRSNYVVLGLFVLCGAFRLLALGPFSCVVLLLLLMGPF